MKSIQPWVTDKDLNIFFPTEINSENTERTGRKKRKKTIETQGGDINFTQYTELH